MELLARLEALLRRAPASSGIALERYQFGDVAVDVRSAEVTHKGQPLELRRRNSSCCAISSSTAAPRSRARRCCRTCGAITAMPSTRTVDVHVAWLRQKLEPNPRVPQFILTVHGMGYKFAG